LNSKRNTAIFFGFLVIILTFLVVKYRWTGDTGQTWKWIIDGDAKGYYAYLQQIFITHDFGHATIDYEQINAVNGHSMIKYYCGTALLMSPFFLLSCIIAWVGHLPIDAYSGLFQKTIGFAGIFYLLVGLFFVGKLLRQLKISQINIFINFILFIFGTNLLTYTVFHPAMSHVFSFFAVSLFLWLFQSFILGGQKKYLLLSAFALGLVYLIRPLNIVIAIFPFFFMDDLKSAILMIKKNSKTFLVSAALFLMTILLQNILWFAQCRQFFIWSYSHEGFYFSHPELFRLLFGFRKGLFIYTPLLGISLLGFLVLLQKNKLRFFVVSGFLMLVAYLLSAWWCWSYSDGFGMRPFIDFYVIFILLFAILLQHVKVWMKWALVVISLVPLSLNLLQNYQYQKGIIHAEYMNRERYKQVFLKTSEEFVDCFGGADDLVPYNRYRQQAIIESPVMPTASTRDSADIVYCRGETGKAYGYDEHFEINYVYSLRNNSELFHADRSYALIHLKKMDIEPTQFHKNLFVIALTYRDKKLAWFRAFPLENYAFQPVGRWREMTYTIILPKIQQKDFTLKFYIWNRSLDIFLVKDVQIKIYKTE
jgi:hypothetical protein